MPHVPSLDPSSTSRELPSRILPRHHEEQKEQEPRAAAVEIELGVTSALEWGMGSIVEL